MLRFQDQKTPGIHQGRESYVNGQEDWLATGQEVDN